MAKIAVTFPADALPAVAGHRLVEGLAGHEVTWGEGSWSNLAPAPCPHGRDADVILGQPAVDDVAASAASWVHLTSAGCGRYDLEALRRQGVVLTTSSSVYAVPVAESALGMILGLRRRLAHSLADQPARRWQAHEHRAASSLLLGARVVVLGWGAIAQELAALMEPWSVEVVAVRRRAAGDEGVHTVGVAELLRVLPGCEVLVNTLPGTPATRGLVGRDVLSRLAPGAVFVNVGRGTTTDGGALQEALASGQLAGAWLDVTDPEPLPADDPLWATPGLFVAPHIAGGWRGEHLGLVEHFLANLQRRSLGQALVDQR